MKSKFVLSTLALAVVLSFSQANALTLNATEEDQEITLNGNDSITSFDVQNGFTGVVTGDEIIINSVLNVTTDGRPTNPASEAYVGTKDTEKVLIKVENGNALNVSGSDLTIRGQYIEIQTKSDNLVMGYGDTIIGGDETETINIGGGAYGLSILPYQSKAGTNGTLTLNAKNINITASDSGIWAQNNSTGYDNAYAPLVLNGENISIIAGNSAVVAMSQGTVELNGNVYVEAKNAILTRGLSKVAINKDGKNTVQLNGDINFNYDEKTSKTTVDADVMINLTNADSYWNGNTKVTWGTGKPEDVSKLEVHDSKLSLSNGARWNVSTVTNEDSPESGTLYVPLNMLNINDGVVNLTENTTQNITIEKMTGSGGTINLLAATEDGKTIESGTVGIDSAEEGIVLAVNAVGITADDINDDEAALQSINDKVSNGVTKMNTVAEGDIRGTISQTFDQAGEAVGEVTRQENTKLLSFRGVNAASLVAWRDEVAYTNQRMEYLRDNTHAFGAWAQVYGGESSYDDATVDLTTTTVQVGADATIGDWIAGAAFSYSKGDADMANGSADTDSYTLSLYTARNFDSGFYVNGLARYGRLSTDATAGNMTASYDNNAFSIGGNVGYRFNFAQQAFVEPNFGLQYAYVMGDDYTATNGVKVEQDDFDALIASLGARVGFNFAEDAGKIYARASVNHDFLGEVDGTASKAGLADSMYVDLGGTWVTYGVGTQFNFTENLSVWGNLDRTTGGEVSTHYMMNAGLRYVF